MITRAYGGPITHQKQYMLTCLPRDPRCRHGASVQSPGVTGLVGHSIANDPADLAAAALEVLQHCAPPAEITPICTAGVRASRTIFFQYTKTQTMEVLVRIMACITHRHETAGQLFFQERHICVSINRPVPRDAMSCTWPRLADSRWRLVR
jgi:hypothetical protein